ncbi:MAG: hypothetical protein CMC70_01435 [Flavobacteriaceae bacterium]|nr:hypothetical protein [Flavobacteriaceae bacterium]|tara:strand:+ start:42 stop:1073 length:1032 start_codon:yes stop_codon:yes gene_type:complete
MAVTETIQTTRQDPAIEAYRLGLLGDVQSYIKDQILGQSVQRLRGRVNPVTGQPYTDQEIVSFLGDPAEGVEGEEGFVAASGPTIEQVQAITAEDVFGPPDYEVQELTANEQEAIDLARSGIGSYQDYIDRGARTAQMGIDALDPRGIGAYMNPYEDAVVQQALEDIGRAGETRRTGIGAQAAASGALGGSRQAVESAKLSEDILREQGRAAAGLRQSGYESAADRAQRAAATYGQLGVQQAGIGEILSGLGTQDLQNLLTTGGVERGVSQADLDARRLTGLQDYSQPFQQYGFLSDIYSGVPTGSSVITAASAPQVSPFQTAAGLGISGLTTAAGARTAGLL